MPREDQNIEQNNDDEVFIKEGVSLTKEQQALYILPQRQLIGFLSQKIALIESDLSKTYCDCLAVKLVSKAYHDWFYAQVNLMIEEEFIKLYRGMHGPQNLFQAVFPGEEIDDFLRKYLRTALAEMEEEKDFSTVTKTKINRVIEVGKEPEERSLPG